MLLLALMNDDDDDGSSWFFGQSYVLRRQQRGSWRYSLVMNCWIERGDSLSASWPLDTNTHWSRWPPQVCILWPDKKKPLRVIPNNNHLRLLTVSAEQKCTKFKFIFPESCCGGYLLDKAAVKKGDMSPHKNQALKIYNMWNRQLGGHLTWKMRGWGGGGGWIKRLLKMTKRTLCRLKRAVRLSWKLSLIF